MGLERWPGSGTAHIGYGVPGNITLDKRLNLVAARQHRIGGFVNAGTRKLLNPIGMVSKFDQHANNRLDTLQAFLNSMDLGGVDINLLKANAYESHVMTSPAVIDPDMGRRISAVCEDSPMIAYGDDTIVTYYDTENDKANTRIDLRSPIMQVDKSGIVRTRRGLAVTSGAGNADYFTEGDFVCASSMPSHVGTDVFTTSADGAVMLFDIETGECKWKERRNRGSIGGWSRIAAGFQGSQNLALWCNRYSLASIDVREPPSLADSALPAVADKYGTSSGSHMLLNFEDRQREIRDLDSGLDGEDAFALTSYDVRWISDCSTKPLLTIEHPISTLDYTVCLYKGKHAKNRLVTLSSQLVPLTFAAVFGSSKSMPTLLDDPYYVETWPTIIPQSHISVESHSGSALYTVGAEGGLYKQQWKEVELGEAIDDRIDLPEPDIPVGASTEKVKVADPGGSHNKHKAFDILASWTPSSIYNFERVYRMAYEPLGPDFDEWKQEAQLSSQNEKVDMQFADAQDADELHELCSRAWVLPALEKKQNEPALVNDDVPVQRERCVNKIVRDMTQVQGEHSQRLEEWKEHKIKLDGEFQAIYDTWGEPQEASDDTLLSSQGWLSQPTQLYDRNDVVSSQASFSDIRDLPLSQPMPTLGASKKKSLKPKHKKKKKRLHSSQP